MLLLSALTLPPVRAEVKVWQEGITIPSYRLDPAETNPIFYTHESYQGAKKVVYPYPLLDEIESRDKNPLSLNQIHANPRGSVVQ